MKPIKAVIRISRVLLLWAVCCIRSSALPAEAVVPDDRDRQVLETALVDLLTDPEFGAPNARANRILILHNRPPEKTRMLRSHFTEDEIGKGHVVPADVEADVWLRNIQPGSDETRGVSFGGLIFNERIVVTNLAGLMGMGINSNPGSFEKAHPAARGWAEMYLPGYSKDGSNAVVRGLIGPTYHPYLVTTLLEKTGDKWVVKWHYLSLFW